MRPDGTSLAELRRERIAITCDDGWRLAADLITPPSPRAVAVVGHAMMVDRRTLDVKGDGLASHLARRGIAVVAADLRGHGDSGPRPSEGGRWSYDDLVERDVPSLIASARGRFPSLRCVAIGHSLFGHAALAHIARHPDAAIDALVMIASAPWGRAWEPSVLARVRKVGTLLGLRTITRMIGYLPARRLRLGSADEPAPYIEQIASFYRRGWRALDGYSFEDALPSVKIPVLSIASDGDRILCSARSAERFAARIGGAEHRTVGRAVGLSFDPDHMQLVTDQRSRSVWDGIADYALHGEK